VSALRETVRFFGVVRPVPRLTRIAFAGITVASALALALSDATGARLLLPVLVLQTFAVSTGFVTYARRGHFDVLLTGGISRETVAVVYWLIAALPGVSCWAALAILEIAVRGHTSLLTAGTLTALTSVSTIPWATTMPLTRFAGAIGWLLILVMVAGLAPVDTVTAHLWFRTADEAPRFTVVACLLFPARLVGQPAAGNWPAIIVVLTAVVTGMVSSVWWVSGTSLALETGQ
jgi:hypothetical protein